MFKQSNYNFLIPLKEERTLVYNSLTRALAVWEADELKIYHQLKRGVQPSDDLTQKFLKGGFLVSAETDEFRVFQERYRMDRHTREAMTLTISPTMACNFKCSYCFQNHDRDMTPMPREVQDAIVAHVETHGSHLRRLHTCWYGGEPLMQTGIIDNLSRRLIQICRARGIQYSSMLVTNGYLLNGPVARNLFRLGVTIIQVTLDGAEADHDARRVLRSGKPTFARIIKNLQETVPQYPGNINIRVNVDFDNYDGIMEMLGCLKDAGLAGTRNLKLYFAPIEAITEFCHNVADISMTKDMYGKREARLVRDTYKGLLTGIPYPPKHRGICAAIRPLGLVVNPNGDLFKCWDTVDKPECSVGTIFRMDEMKHNEIHKRWLAWDPLEDSRCRQCKLLPSCSGACAFKALYQDQPLGEQAQLPCISWRYNINERLLLRAEIAGVIGEDDYDPEAVATDPDSLLLPDSARFAYDKTA